MAIYMKIGVFTDIHNNLPALEAILQKLEQEGCEAFLCPGDIIGIGPEPEETVKRVMGIPNLTAVAGNHDRYLWEGLPTVFPNEEHMEQGEVELHKWEHGLLSQKSEAFLRSLPLRADLTFSGVSIAVLHYCMNEQNRYVNYTPVPTDEDCGRIFADETAKVVLYGHNHRPAVNRYRGTLYVNCGSLGCPAQDRNIARGGILTLEDGQADFQAVTVTYEVEQVLSRITQLNYPDSQIIKAVFYGRKS